MSEELKVGKKREFYRCADERVSDFIHLPSYKKSVEDEARRGLIEELEKEITYGENAELYNYETLCAKDLWDNIQEWIEKKEKELQP